MIKWYNSKVVWLNIAMFATLAAALFLPGSQFSDLVSPKVAEYISLGVALVNLALRVFATNEPIAPSLR